MSETVTENGAEVWEIPDGWQWLRKSQAAAHLEVTEKTIDNRVGAGKLQKRVQAGVVEVLVPPRDEESQATRALALMERYNEALAKQTFPLVSQIRELSEEVGKLKADNENLRNQLQNSSRLWWQFWK